MKQLTIRTKVTFWYAMIMVLMAASTLGLLLSVSETAHLSDQKSRLMETVKEAAEDISEDGEDVFDSFEDGVYLYKNLEVIKIEQDFEKTQALSEEVTLESLLKMPMAHRLCGYLFSLIGPLM